MKKLPRSFYDRDTVQVAKELLGKYIVHISDKKRVAKIVEVEAYLGEHDLAAHSARGLTPRNKVMFGPPGYAYIYLIYGLHYCFNVVTEKSGHASAILVRAIQPILNIEDNTKGPGLLCKALKINKNLQGHDLLSDNFYLTFSEDDEEKFFSIVKRPRIGIPYAKHWAKRLLRFYIKDNPFISKK